MADFASFVTHEVGNALTTLQLAVLLLRESEPGSVPEKREAAYNTIDRTLEHLRNVCATFLSMRRVEHGDFHVQPEPTRLRACMHNVLAMFEPLVEKKNLLLKTVFPEQPVVVEIDPLVLSLVASNLIGNAIKYTPEGGSVVVRIERPDGRARLCIEDTGIGITPENLSRILKTDYYRSPRGEAAASGFGAGMTLVRRLLDLSGLRLEIDSGPNRGTRCAISLPLSAKPAS